MILYQSCWVLIQAALSLRRQSLKLILAIWIVVDCRHQLGEGAGTSWRPAAKVEHP